MRDLQRRNPALAIGFSTMVVHAVGGGAWFMAAPADAFSNPAWDAPKRLMPGPGMVGWGAVLAALGCGLGLTWLRRDSWRTAQALALVLAMAEVAFSFFFVVYAVAHSGQGLAFAIYVASAAGWTAAVAVSIAMTSERHA